MPRTRDLGVIAHQIRSQIQAKKVGLSFLPLVLKVPLKPFLKAKSIKRFKFSPFIRQSVQQSFQFLSLFSTIQLIVLQ